MKAEDLMAYVDGELTPEEAKEVEHELTRNTEFQKRVAIYCRQRFMLVEVLQEQEVKRVPRPQRKASSWKFRLAAAAAVFVAVAALIVLGHKDQPIARIVLGDVTLSNSIITTTANQKGTVQLSDKSFLELAPDTEVRIENFRQGRSIRLDRGTLTCEVQKSEIPVKVETPVGVLQVLGTRFKIKTGVIKNTDGEIKKATLVGVYAGHVQFTTVRDFVTPAREGEVLFTEEGFAPMKSRDPRAWKYVESAWDAPSPFLLFIEAFTRHVRERKVYPADLFYTDIKRIMPETLNFTEDYIDRQVEWRIYDELGMFLEGWHRSDPNLIAYQEGFSGYIQSEMYRKHSGTRNAIDTSFYLISFFLRKDLSPVQKKAIEDFRKEIINPHDFRQNAMKAVKRFQMKKP